MPFSRAGDEEALGRNFEVNWRAAGYLTREAGNPIPPPGPPPTPHPPQLRTRPHLRRPSAGSLNLSRFRASLFLPPTTLSSECLSLPFLHLIPTPLTPLLSLQTLKRNGHRTIRLLRRSCVCRPSSCTLSMRLYNYYSTARKKAGDPYTYLPGFGNSFASEAIPGALPVGQNSPQKVAWGLYAEQVSPAVLRRLSYTAGC